MLLLGIELLNMRLDGQCHKTLSHLGKDTMLTEDSQ